MTMQKKFMWATNLFTFKKISHSEVVPYLVHVLTLNLKLLFKVIQVISTLYLCRLHDFFYI
jgi:hypothetical protein